MKTLKRIFAGICLFLLTAQAAFADIAPLPDPREPTPAVIEAPVEPVPAPEAETLPEGFILLVVVIFIAAAIIAYKIAKKHRKR
jgi:ABC-type antimicrobial peptide transport system permease subunit